MDQQKLRTLVFEKTGVKIDIDDPIFALVALNEAVLAEAVERHVALMDDASADLADQLQALHDRSGPCRFGLAEGAPAPARPAGPAPAGAGWSPQERRSMTIAGAAAVLGALLVLLGQALFFKPPVALPSTVIAKELTPEQAMAIARGEKLTRIMQKLDPKTRNAITAELQKP